MSEFIDGLKDGMDVVDSLDFANKLMGVEDFVPEGYSDFMGPMGFALDGVEFVEGYQKYQEADEFHPMAIDGLHDMISGGGGMMEEAAGDTKIGKVLQAFNVGFTAGDAIAPYVYGEEPQGARTEKIPEDGIFKPTTGNSVVDYLFGV